jgi:hypothetical protein
MGFLRITVLQATDPTAAPHSYYGAATASVSADPVGHAPMAATPVVAAPVVATPHELLCDSCCRAASVAATPAAVDPADAHMASASNVNDIETKAKTLRYRSILSEG